MEAPQDGIWIIGVEGEIVFANQRMAEILGTSIAKLIGQYSYDYVFPEDLLATHRLFEAMERGEAEPFHFELRRIDGSGVWVEMLGAPLHEAGIFTGIVGTLRLR